MKEQPPKENFENSKSTAEQWGIPEYNFEEGVQEIVSRITKSLETQPYAVIAFTGSSASVGKTTLAINLAEIFRKQGMDVHLLHGKEELEYKNINTKSKKIIFIFEQMEWGSTSVDIYEKAKTLWEEETANALKKIGCDVHGIDLWVGIYTQEKPFATHKQSGDAAKPIADILIRNDKATDRGKI